MDREKTNESQNRSASYQRSLTAPSAGRFAHVDEGKSGFLRQSLSISRWG